MTPSFAIELHRLGLSKHAGWMDRLRSFRKAVGDKLDDLRAYKNTVSKDLDRLSSMEELSHLDDTQKSVVRAYAGLARVSDDAQTALLRTTDRLGNARRVPTEDAVQLANKILERTEKKVPSSRGSLSYIDERYPFLHSRATVYQAHPTAAPQLISLSPNVPAAIAHELGHVRDYAKQFPKGLPSFEAVNDHINRARSGRGVGSLLADEIRANMHAVPSLVREYGFRKGLDHAVPLAPAFGTYIAGASSGFGQKVVDRYAPGVYGKWKAMKTSQIEEQWFKPVAGKSPLDTLDRRSVRKFRKPNTRFLPPSLESGKSLR